MSGYTIRHCTYRAVYAVLCTFVNICLRKVEKEDKRGLENSSNETGGSMVYALSAVSGPGRLKLAQPPLG